MGNSQINTSESYTSIAVSVQTPYSTGSGCLYSQRGLVFTSLHTIRNCADIVVGIEGIGLVKPRVLCMDEYHDLAILKLPDGVYEEIAPLRFAEATKDQNVCSLGKKSKSKLPEVTSTVMSTSYRSDQGIFIQHSAHLKPGYSGGPIIADDGAVLGINMLAMEAGRTVALSLSISVVLELVNQIPLEGEKESYSYCQACEVVVSLGEVALPDLCPHCFHRLSFPESIPRYELTGSRSLIENMLELLDFDPSIARRQMDLWVVYQGSARIELKYFEDSDLISVESRMVRMPEGSRTEVLRYLLRLNYKLSGMSLHLRDDCIYLRLLIGEDNLSSETGVSLIRRMLETADELDNVFVEDFACTFLPTS